MVECAMESLCIGLSIVHSTIKDIMVAEIWSIENGQNFSISKLILPYLLTEANFGVRWRLERMSHNFFGKTLVTPVECAMESPMHGLSIAHSTIIKDIIVAEIWSQQNLHQTFCTFHENLYYFIRKSFTKQHDFFFFFLKIVFLSVKSMTKCSKYILKSLGN